MKRGAEEVERRRQVHARAPEFILGLTHRLWLGRKVFAPGFVQPRKYPSGQVRYLLAHDGEARQWAHKWLSEFVSEVEHALGQALIPASRSMKRGRKPSSNDRKIKALLMRKRTEQLKQTLKNAGFVAWRQLLPHVEAILAAQARVLPAGQQLVLRQLPRVLARIERDLWSSIGTSGSPVPSEIAPTEVQAAHKDRDNLLLRYMPMIQRELATVIRLHMPKGMTRGKRREGRPLGRGGVRDSAGEGDPVDLRPYRARILKMRGILNLSYTTSLHSRLAWLLEITGIWPCHYLETTDLANPSPSSGRPFPHPSQFTPCSSCRTSARVQSCSRRSRLFREWMKDIGNPRTV